MKKIIYIILLLSSINFITANNTNLNIENNKIESRIETNNLNNNSNNINSNNNSNFQINENELSEHDVNLLLSIANYYKITELKILINAYKVAKDNDTKKYVLQEINWFFNTYFEKFLNSNIYNEKNINNSFND